MSTIDGAIDKKLFYDLEWIYHCLLPKTIMQMKHLPSIKFYLSLSAQIKQHNRYSRIINSLKSWIAASFCHKSEFAKLVKNRLKPW